MPKTFDPDTEMPDLSGKVIVVTGGRYSNCSWIQERFPVQRSRDMRIPQRRSHTQGVDVVYSRLSAHHRAQKQSTTQL